MKLRNILRVTALAAMILTMCSYADAQPGGPGGRPPSSGSGHGRPTGRRPPMTGDWNQMQGSQQAQQVKQKKKVKEGDTFKVVGELRDSVSGEFLAFVNVAVLDSADSSFVKGAALAEVVEEAPLDVGVHDVAGCPAHILPRKRALTLSHKLMRQQVTTRWFCSST